MNKKMKMTTKALTEGAIFCAIYAVFMVLTRYLLTSTDSLIYYIVPLPLAMYTYKYSYKEGIISLVVVILVSFLLINPILILTLWVPNLIVGVVMGALLKGKLHKSWIYLITFLLCFIADITAIYAYQITTGVGYFTDVVEIFKTFLSPITTIEESTLYNLVESISICVLLIDSLIKCILLNMLFTLFMNRLHYCSTKVEHSFIRIQFHPWIGILHIILFLCSTLLLYTSFHVFNLWIKIIFIIVLSAYTILSFYILYQVSFYLSIAFSLSNMKRGLVLFLIFLFVLCFPITVLMGVVLNFIKPIR